MKLKILLLGAALGLVAIATQKAAAFPLNLTALSGTITSTANYGSDGGSTTNKVKVVAVNLKTVMTVVSNEISLQKGVTNAPPANSRIAYDPYKFQIYVTNNNGYFCDITQHGTNGCAQIGIYGIGTSFHPVAPDGGAENDVILLYLSLYGRGTDGLDYEFSLYGRGKLVYVLNGKTGRGTMVISAAGSDVGQYKDSDSGVATGSAVFSGSGTPEWEGPYSVYWWNE